MRPFIAGLDTRWPFRPTADVANSVPSAFRERYTFPNPPNSPNITYALPRDDIWVAPIPPSSATSHYMLAKLTEAHSAFVLALAAAHHGEFRVVHPEYLCMHLFYMHYVLHYLADIAQYMDYTRVMQSMML